MLNRTSRLLCAGVLVLAPALASCSTEMPTEAVYTPAAGTNERSLDVDVLNAMIVSSEAGSGTLVTTLVNNNGLALAQPADAADDTLTGVTVDGRPARFEPITIPADGKAVVATRNETLVDAVGGIKVTGDFEPGQFLPVTFTFQNAGEVELDVPVLRNEEGSYVAGQDGEPVATEEPAAHGDEGESGGGH